jgi:hypothetical protein
MDDHNTTAASIAARNSSDEIADSLHESSIERAFEDEKTHILECVQEYYRIVSNIDGTQNEEEFETMAVISSFFKVLKFYGSVLD